MKKKFNYNKLFAMATVAAIAIPAVVVASPVQAASSFSDVGENHPYNKTIHDMQKRGVISGYPDGTFRPNESISRKHVAALLGRTLPLEAKEKAVAFTDVPNTHPYHDVIQKAQQAGIFDGDAEGNFHPDAPLTRMQMAKVLVLALDIEVGNQTHPFTDVSSSNWADSYIAALYATGITTGDKGKYHPGNQVTRAHYAVFLDRALKLIDGGEAIGPIPDKPIITTPETGKVSYRETLDHTKVAVSKVTDYTMTNESETHVITKGSVSGVGLDLNMKLGLQTVSRISSNPASIHRSNNLMMFDTLVSVESYLMEHGTFSQDPKGQWYKESEKESPEASMKEIRENVAKTIDAPRLIEKIGGFSVKQEGSHYVFSNMAVQNKDFAFDWYLSEGTKDYSAAQKQAVKDSLKIKNLSVIYKIDSKTYLPVEMIVNGEYTTVDDKQTTTSKDTEHIVFDKVNKTGEVNLTSDIRRHLATNR